MRRLMRKLMKLNGKFMFETFSILSSLLKSKLIFKTCYKLQVRDSCQNINNQLKDIFFDIKEFLL